MEVYPLKLSFFGDTPIYPISFAWPYIPFYPHVPIRSNVFYLYTYVIHVFHQPLYPHCIHYTSLHIYLYVICIMYMHTVHTYLL